jgi:hypothetical protein
VRNGAGAYSSVSCDLRENVISSYRCINCVAIIMWPFVTKSAVGPEGIWYSSLSIQTSC